MEEGLDTGPVYRARREAIGEAETAGQLSARLAVLGAALLVETLAGLEAGNLEAVPQRGEPSLCKPIRREEGLVDWTLPAALLLRRHRAFSPWPGLYTHLKAERVKVLEAGLAPEARLLPGGFDLVAGELLVGAGEGTAMVLRRLQRAGRNAVTGAEFARGVDLPGRFDGARP